MLRIFEFGVLLFDCFVNRQKFVSTFTSYGHYAGEVESGRWHNHRQTRSCISNRSTWLFFVDTLEKNYNLLQTVCFSTTLHMQTDNNGTCHAVVTYRLVFIFITTYPLLLFYFNLNISHKQFPLLQSRDSESHDPGLYMCIACGILYTRNHSTVADAVNPRTRCGSTLADNPRTPIRSIRTPLILASRSKMADIRHLGYWRQNATRGQSNAYLNKRLFY